MNQTVTISTFYKFMPLPNYRDWREPLREAMRARNIKGTITLAPEGINATVSGEPDKLQELVDIIENNQDIGNIIHKDSHSSIQPFQRCKVKVKRELISLGVKTEPAVCVGEYIAPAQWNALISRPDVVTIDTRNDYEYRIGHFQGAINPATRDFKEMVAFTEQHLDPAVHQSVAMYCTGGIRCEKYSSYLVARGFRNVYHLHGGILRYLADIPVTESLWEGACYVFDERVAVNHDLSTADHITMCGPCGQPLTSADRADAGYVENVRCPYCDEHKR
jgi:UPF0176 protein